MLLYEDPSGISATVSPHVQGLMCTLVLSADHYLFRYNGVEWPQGRQGDMNLRENFPTPIRIHFWDSHLRTVGFVPSTRNIDCVLRELRTMIDCINSVAYQEIFERMYEGQ
jgi:hypothetical protein